ncbi:hypothetical protein RB200_23930 [Streptomyces sp. PmtG]
MDAGSAAGAGALAGWLRRDPAVARAGVEIEAAHVPTGPPGPPGAMGGLETVTAVVDSTVGLLGLLVAVAAWRRAPGTPPPTVRVIESDGTVLEGTPDDVARLVRARGEREQTGT